jgi:hypothetical protein
MTQTYKPGIPFTQRITQFDFWYQYNPNGNDTAECRVELVQAGGIPVGGGAFKTGASTSGNGWQHAVINMNYVSGATPDTLWILFSASTLDFSPKAGSVLWIDDVAVTYPVGINQTLFAENDVEVFPNPSNGIFTIHQQNIVSQKQTIEVYNLIGEKIYSTTQNQKEIFDIDISNSSNGIYFVKIIDGNKIHTEKIVKQ